jgi:hypothetical protein
MQVASSGSQGWRLNWYGIAPQRTGANRHHIRTETGSTCEQVWEAGFRPGTHALTSGRLLPPLVPHFCAQLA